MGKIILLDNLHSRYLNFKFFAVTGYNRRGFFLLWDTTEEFFSVVGYNGEGFPSLWVKMEEVFFPRGFFLLWLQ
jgi:hypothetical protein